MQRNLIIVWIFFGAVFTMKGQVNSIEYFSDTDPGYGNGINAGTASLVDDTNNKVYEQLSFNAPINSLTDGLHTLYIRAKNAKGWSQTLSRPFVKMNLPQESIHEVNYVEYFLDTDPGYGKGTEIPLNIENDALAFNIDLTAVKDGFHTLYIRAKNTYNHWSQVMSRPFMKTLLPSDIASELTDIEYYLDTDPGTGNGIPVPFSTDATQLEFTVDLNLVSPGNHILYLRGKNNTGQWISIEEHHFIVIDDEINVHNFTDSKEIVISPNPVKSILHFQSSSPIEQVIIYDVNGKIVGKNLGICLENQINVSHLANGIYLVKIKTIDGELVQKIIKQ